VNQVHVNVCGDHWCNSDDFETDLYSVPNHAHIHLVVNSEGPSLGALGVIDRLQQFCNQTGRDITQITISGWGNAVEPIPMQREGLFLYSHFYFLSDRYWIDTVPECNHDALFGLFIGRKTIPRQIIMWHMWQHHGDRCLISQMKNNSLAVPWGVNLEHLQDWINHDQMASFHAWWAAPPVCSIDQHELDHQYDPAYNTNLDLLMHYHRFDIEIVCETYTRGNCFFPTEKTIRPMVALKPMLIHGPRNYLERLREQGFRTWGHIWCERYDQYEGPERWHHMKNTIDHLASLEPQELRQLLHECAEVCAHNRINLINIKSMHAPQ
jgi:hypothetical protein